MCKWEYIFVEIIDKFKMKEHLFFCICYFNIKHLRSHPVRRADETVGGTSNARGAKVRQLDVSHVRHQDVARLDIPEHRNNLSTLWILCRARVPGHRRLYSSLLRFSLSNVEKRRTKNP